MQSGPVNWPSTSGNPINEFTTEGYMSCAFPTLFPTGAALNTSCYTMINDLPNILILGTNANIVNTSITL